MRLRHLIMGLAALHMATAATVTPEVSTRHVAISATGTATQSASAPTEIGSGFKAALTCAGCLTAGTIFIASGGAATVGITLAIGGTGAVAIGSAVAMCMYACYEALS